MARYFQEKNRPGKGTHNMLTDVDYELRYKELQGVTIQLDPDPVQKGLVSINKKSAEIQGEKEKGGALLIEAIKNKSEANIHLDAKKGDHSRQLDGLLAGDEEVKAQKSAELRKATANVKLKDLVTDLAYTELDAQKADVYHKCVQQVYSQLDSANMNLSRQMSVIEMEIKIQEISKKAPSSLFEKTIPTK